MREASKRMRQDTQDRTKGKAETSKKQNRASPVRVRRRHFESGREIGDPETDDRPPASTHPPAEASAMIRIPEKAVRSGLRPGSLQYRAG